MLKNKCPKNPTANFFALFLGSLGSTPLFSFHFVSLLQIQILKSRISQIVCTFIKVKIVHSLPFQLEWGKQEGEESTLIGSTHSIILQATLKPKAHHLLYLHIMYPLNTSFHFDTSPLQFFTSLPFTTTLKFSQFCQKITPLKTLGMPSNMLNLSLCYAPSAKSTNLCSRKDHNG